MSNKVLIVSSDKVLNTFLRKVIINRIDDCRIKVYERFSETQQRNAFDYSVIIVDEVIIGSSGFEIINQLRFVERNINKIIFLCDAESETKRAKTLGANAALLKPLNADEFVALVKDYLYKVA